MNELMPVNPKVLRWARETAGFSVDDVVKKIKRKRVTAETVEDWEKGGSTPSYAQLERLAYEIYKRPLALFFFPEPPQEESPDQSFRTLPKHEVSKIKPRLRYLIRQARVMQINLSELNEGGNPAPKQILKDLSFSPDDSVAMMATQVREYLGIDLAKQTAWRSTDEAFKSWRDAFEKYGVFVFKEAFKDSAFSGFCLYDQQFPIIYVNNSTPDTRQIFTLFHELAHLLLGTGGVDTRLSDYLHLLSGVSRKTEILCNGFAGSFLVPDEDFDRITQARDITDGLVEQMAKKFHVSREVILRKFLNRGLITNSYYDEKTAQWDREKSLRSGTGGDYYLTKRTYLGTAYLEMAFSHYYQKKISLEQLANYLGVKVRNVTGMESLVFEKGTA